MIFLSTDYQLICKIWIFITYFSGELLVGTAKMRNLIFLKTKAEFFMEKRASIMCVIFR